MKELIKKIEVNDVWVEQKLEWLLGGNNHGLHPEGNTEVIRFLLKKVVELEDKVETLTHQGTALKP